MSFYVSPVSHSSTVRVRRVLTNDAILIGSRIQDCTLFVLDPIMWYVFGVDSSPKRVSGRFAAEELQERY